MASECCVKVIIMQWVWFIASLACVTPGFAIHEHYHELSKRVFRVDSINPDASFGFSISSVHSSQKSKLVIGAPLADITGQMYTCELINNEAGKCINTNRAGIYRYSDKPEYANLSYWYGATVMGTDEGFVGCAPLAIDKDTIIFGKSPAGVFGRCYWNRDDKKTPILLSTIKSTIGVEQRLHNLTFEDTMDSFGWSLFVSPDGILIGGPAVWCGRVFKIKPTEKLVYANGMDNDVKFNFGYAVTAGRFFKWHKPISAVGSTYEHGQVVFVVDDGPKMKKKYSLRGPSVGSMFGAVLCPAYLHPYDPSKKYRVSDLLVGAPTFAQNEAYNLGAVFVVTGTAALLKPKLQRSIVGASSDSFFGSAIVSLGDINNDNIDEIAIAAPYESGGRGTVYLYSGADLLKSDVRPIQTIVPESTLSLRSFGYSLTVVRDYDDNGCNELAIGAPESNKVMLLRCIAAITITLNEFESQLDPTNGLDRNETLRVCLNATFPDKPAFAKADMQVVINIQHNDAKFDNSGKSETVEILVQRENRTKTTDRFCKNVTLVIHGSKGDYGKKIVYDMKATLQNSPIDKKHFEGSDVTLNDNSLLSVAGTMWVQECGTKKCVPDLSMTTLFSAEKTRYEIGSLSSIIVTMVVQNQGDVAFDACVRVSAVGARVADGECAQLAEGGVECTPRQLPRPNQAPWTIDGISVDMTQLTNENDKVTITVELFNECKTNAVAQKPSSKTFDLYADPDRVHVYGRTNEGLSDIVKLTRDDIRALKTFDHVYKISNNGPTTWVNINITVVAKKLDFVNRSVYIQEQACKAENSTDSEETIFSCFAERLDVHAEIEAKVVMQVVADKLNDRIDKETLFVSSSIMVQLGDTFKQGNVTSELKLLEGKIAIWVIVATVILALILLAIVLFIMKECGLLKRKNKVELKKVRTSVRRQTIMRQSMNRPVSHNPQPIDPSEAIASQNNQKKKKDRRVVVNEE